MEIDIRNEDCDEVGSIRFRTPMANESAKLASTLEWVSGSCDVWLKGDNDSFIGIKDKETAVNMVKAINKAIDLGWFE